MTVRALLGRDPLSTALFKISKPGKDITSLLPADYLINDTLGNAKRLLHIIVTSLPLQSSGTPSGGFTIYTYSLTVSYGVPYTPRLVRSSGTSPGIVYTYSITYGASSLTISIKANMATGTQPANYTLTDATVVHVLNLRAF